MTIQGATTLFLVNMKRIFKLEKQKRQKIMNDKQENRSIYTKK